MTDTHVRVTSLKHPIYQGLVAAIIGVVGVLIGNSGLFAGQLPGNPTVKVPGPIVTVPGPIVTVTAPSSTSKTTTAAAVHLADQTSRPVDALADVGMNDQSNIGINGKAFDSGWVQTIGATNLPQSLMGINLKRAFSLFEARVGVLDTSAESSAKIEIRADGKVIWAKVVSLQTSYDVKLRIEGVQRLEIKTYTPQSNDITIAIGDPTVSP